MSTSKAKGSAGEREVARLFGEGAKRSPLSGAVGSMGDLVFPSGSMWNDWNVEVKRRKRIGGVAVKDALDQAQAVIGIGDRRKPMAIMREDHGQWIMVVYAEDMIAWCEALAEIAGAAKIKGLVRQLKRDLEALENSL